MMNFQLWSTVFGFVFIYFLFRLIQWIPERRKFIAIFEKLPGKKSGKLYFILGNALDVFAPREEFFNKLRAYFNQFLDHQVVSLWIGAEGRAVFIKAEAVETLLNNTNNLDKSRLYVYLHKWLGLGLLTSTGAKWHSRRKMLTPSFHFKILEEFIEVINEQAVILNKKMQQHVGKQQGFDVYPYVSLCALDVICETAMRRRINAQSNSESVYVKAVSNLAEGVNLRSFRPWLDKEWMYYNLSSIGKLEKKNLSIVHKFTDDVIVERRKKYDDKKSKEVESSKEEELVFGKKKKLAFLDTLLEYSENGKRLSDKSIREEVDTFMFEGHDTTSAGINWSIFLLGHNPEVQQKVHNELDLIFGDSDRHVTAADLKELKYLECVIKESMRIYPPVPFFARTITKSINCDGYEIPVGTNAIIAPYFVHRDPKYYPDPEKFDPDRFLPENNNKRHPYAYIPFSAGARNCIGQKFAFMEMKIILCHVMRNFKMKSMQKTDEVIFFSELILRPGNGTIITLENRK